MKIAYFARDNGACAYYRLALPLETVAQKNGTRVFSFMRGDSSEKILRCLEANILAIPRVGERQFLDLVPRVKKEGKKIVIDHDDNLFKVSPLNPHYEDAGTKEVMASINGEKIPMWIDRRNVWKYKHMNPKPNIIDIEKNKQRLDALAGSLKLADLITVTQPILAEVYSKYNDNVKCLPNCIEPSLWKRLPLKREHENEIRLYWSGGSSHYEDWLLLQDVIPEIMVEYPQVKLIIMGQKFDGTLTRIPKDRFEFHPWVALPAYPYKTAIIDPDICVIPLQDNEFNRCKSPIKWVEMAALKVPCVTSYVSPYKELETADNGIFIRDNDPDAWIEGISMLIQDKGLRDSIAESAHQTMLEHFDINSKWYLWHDAYKELLQ